MQQTLIIIKPDGVQRGFVGEILARMERKGLKIVGLKLMRLKEAVLREHYAHVVDQPFFADLAQFMSASPVAVAVLEGIDAVQTVRNIAGTNPKAPGTIRGDFSISPQRNVIHSSDSEEAASREVARFFTDEELFEYEKDEWKHVFPPQ